MNLCVDIGNSRAKLGIFKHNQLQLEKAIPIDGLAATVKNLFSDYPGITQCILSATGKVPGFLKEMLAQNTTLLILDRSWQMPFKNNYKSPDTLGLDRIALVSAATFLYPGKNCLIIDAGTCVTYDFLSAQKEYQGGAITPGLLMRYRAMNQQTANLPLLEKDESAQVIGDSTENSIHSGAVNGLCFEVDGWIGHYRSQYQDLTVILTGGDADFLSKRLKNAIFAHSNFLLEGLNYLLEINKV